MPKLIVQQFISVKSVVSLVSWLLFAMCCTLSFTLFYLLQSLDSHVSEELRQRVNLAKNMEVEFGERILSEYTFWDDAYQKIYVEQDKEWIHENSGDYIVFSHDFDFTLATLNGRETLYFTKNKDVDALTFAQLNNNGFKQLIALSDNTDTITKIASGLVIVNEDVYLLSGGPLIDEELEAPRKGTFLVFGKRLDQAYLDSLAENYQIEGLTIRLGNSRSPDHMVLTDLTGKKFATASWKAPTPSHYIAPWIVLVLFLFTAITILATRHLFTKEKADRAAYENKLYEEATTDHLTRVSNRRYFTEMGQNLLNTYIRQNKKLAVLMLDIDHFKSFNDNYGHSLGDQALIHFTEVCKQELRESDVFGRLGGEEFAIVFPDADMQQAMDFANLLRLRVEQTPLDYDDHTVSMTVSIGVSVLHRQIRLNDMLKQADDALYLAKRAGRNQVVLYDSASARSVNLLPAKEKSLQAG